MLHYIMLCYFTLCYVKLHYVMLHYIMLCYITLHYVMLHYIMLCYITVCYVTLQYVMSHYIMLCYITFYYVIFQGETLQLILPRLLWKKEKKWPWLQERIIILSFSTLVNFQPHPQTSDLDVKDYERQTRQLIAYEGKLRQKSFMANATMIRRHVGMCNRPVL